MRYALSLSAIATALALSAAPSHADRKAADACAAHLSAGGKLIYAAVGTPAPGADLREVVRDKTRGLVMSGKLKRNEARADAEAAGACLVKAR